MEKILTTEDYIAQFPKEIRVRLEEIRAAIKKAAPKATEKISYNMPAFFFKKNLVFFAAFKNHIGFYPLPAAIKKFKKELADYKYAKGSIQFSYDKPLPIKLITDIVKARIKEVS